MNPDHLRLITEAYTLGSVQKVTDVAEGVLNKNYVIETTTGKYFIKSVRPKSQSRLPYTAAVERFMATQDIPAVCMLPTNSSELWLYCDDIMYCVYPFIESDRSHRYTAEDYTKFGILLGRIHRTGSADIPANLQAYAWEEKPKEGVIKELLQYQARIKDKVQKEDIDNSFLKYIQLKLDSAVTLDMNTILENDTLIQGDYHAGNLLIHPGSREIVGVCDWEKAEMAPRAMELARSILYMCFDNMYRSDLENRMDFAQRMISGYQSIFPISQSELRAGFIVRLRRHVLTHWLENHYYDMGDDRSNKFLMHEIHRLEDFLTGPILDQVAS